MNVKSVSDGRKIHKLRFPGFMGEWEEKELGALFVFKNGVNAEKSQYGTGYKFINVLDIIDNEYITHDKIRGSVNISEKEFKRNKVDYGDVLFQRSSETREEVGQANVYLDKKTPATFGGFVIMGKKIDDYEPVFMNYLLKTPVVRKDITSRSGGSTRYNIGQESLQKVSITIPSLPEQQKIAGFLGAADEWISNLRAQKKALEAYKKGMIQKLFSQEIRFKDDDGDDFPEWEEKRLEEICERITRKNNELNQNVLTISAQQGLIQQESFFTKLVSASNVSGYYLLKKGEFAYNKSYSNGYPMGAIKRLVKYEEGVVSTLYICFCIKNASYSGDFLEKYFDAGILNNEIKKIAQEGARAHGLLNMSIIDFFKKITLLMPSFNEQQKIANFLSAIDALIEAKQSQIAKAVEWKKGLMQRLFV